MLPRLDSASQAVCSGCPTDMQTLVLWRACAVRTRGLGLARTGGLKARMPGVPAPSGQRWSWKALLALTRCPGPEDWTLEHHRGLGLPLLRSRQAVDPSVGLRPAACWPDRIQILDPGEGVLFAASCPAKRAALSK